jgi:SAM-dependent methyltransferase
MQRKSEQRKHGFGRHLEAVLDPQRVFEEIGLKTGDTLLDVGCGGGRFSIPGAEIVGAQGKVYAFDASEERLAPLKDTIRERDLANIEAFVDDVTQHISVEDNWIDVCLMANVFHEIVEKGVETRWHPSRRGFQEGCRGISRTAIICQVEPGRG